MLRWEETSQTHPCMFDLGRIVVFFGLISKGWPPLANRIDGTGPSQVKSTAEKLGPLIHCAVA